MHENPGSILYRGPWQKGSPRKPVGKALIYARAEDAFWTVDVDASDIKEPKVLQRSHAAGENAIRVCKNNGHDVICLGNVAAREYLPLVEVSLRETARAYKNSCPKP